MTCKRIPLKDGVAIVCTRGPGRGATCSIPGCSREHEVLCDYPVKVAGRKSPTCDKKLCRGHAVNRGPELDYCPAHAKLPEPQEPAPTREEPPLDQMEMF